MIETERAPWSLRALGGVGVLAVVLMAFAPQVGALDPRDGYTDAVTTGGDGVAHYEGPETSRRVDVQLVALDHVAAPAGVKLADGREVLAVRVRLAAARGSDAAGCRVELRSERAEAVDATPVPGPACGAGAGGSAPVEVLSTVLLAVPSGTRVAQVRVMWEPPVYASFPAP